MIVHVRPPPGYRTYDERGVPLVWRMNVPLYGQADAGLIWYRTVVEHLYRPRLGLSGQPQGQP